MSVKSYFENVSLQRAVDQAKIVAFDMNGLIVDDEPVQHESVNRALRSTGFHITENYWIERCVGKRADEYFTAILEEGGLNSKPAIVSGFVAEKNRLYRELVVKKVHDLVRPGVPEFIDYLTEVRRTPLALCTSAHPAEIDAILGRGGLNLKERFTHLLSGLDVTKSKPDPETYRALAVVAGCDPASCLVFEDSGLGVQAAVDAGTVCIAVPNRFTAHHQFNGAFAVIETLNPDAGFVTNTSM
jgi:HAD superfamily hydrolase (TIGR01509 family)